jgi:hypothetical protein
MMSETSQSHRVHGLEGYLIQRFGHPTGEHLAEAVFRHPAVVAWIHDNPLVADVVGEGLDLLAGFGEVPGDSPIIVFINRVFEVFAARSREILEQLAAQPDDRAKADQAADVLVQTAGELAAQEKPMFTTTPKAKPAPASASVPAVHAGIGKIIDLLLHLIGEEAEALKKRLKEKQSEDKHLLADLRKALGQIQTWSDRRYNAIHYSRRVRAKRGSKLAKLALVVSVIGVVWVIYFGLTESRATRETNNHTQHTEVTHVR